MGEGVWATGDEPRQVPHLSFCHPAGTQETSSSCVPVWEKQPHEKTQVRDVLVTLALGDRPPVARLIYGVDVREGLRMLDTGSVHCCVTSPPYFGLRDYGTAQWEGGSLECAHTVRSASAMERSRETSTLGGGKDAVGHSKEGYKKVCAQCGAIRIDSQLGMEETPDLYVEHMVEVFREVRRVLRDDGTLWLNLGDSYAQPKGHGKWVSKGDKGDEHSQRLERFWEQKGAEDMGLKGKDLMGIPWRVALALQADGWWLRNALIWAKPNSMPSPVQDRFSCTYEHVFLLTKQGHYYFDLDAVRVPYTYGEYGPDGNFQPAQQWLSEDDGQDKKMDQAEEHGGMMAGPGRTHGRNQYHPGGKNPGDVFSVPTQPFSGSHFACMPEALPERFIKAGTSEYGVCSICRDPWKRVTTRTDAQGNKPPNGMGRKITEDTPKKKALVERVPLGWVHACDCKSEIKRALVLDPFSGSATTGRVSVRLNRDYVGIDLNESYLPMAMARVRDDPPPAPPEAPPEGSVLDVFG